MKEIACIEDISALALLEDTNWRNYGEVYSRESGDLLIFNYASKAQQENRWNYFERVSRGLIINRKTGEVVARPFDKFYNWDENGRKTSAKVVSVIEKLDGSLGILYRQGEEKKIATRGSFDGPQAQWATGHLNSGKYLLDFPDEWTLLFEIIYPENRIIVDYGDGEALALLAIRNRFTGEYLPEGVVEITAAACGFFEPSYFNATTVEEIISVANSLDEMHEGFVVAFSDGQRFKFKGPRYRALHSLVFGMTFKKILSLFIVYGDADSVGDLIPEDLRHQFDEWEEEILTVSSRVLKKCYNVFETAPAKERRRFAYWANNNHKKYAPYLFALLDGKDIYEMVLKREFKDRKDEQL